MQAHKLTIALFAVSFTSALVGNALAQPAAPAQPTSQTQPTADRPTLIKRDTAGNLIRVDSPVEYAAVAALKLSDDEKAKIAIIFAEYENTLDGALRHATANISRVARVVEENNNAEIQGKLNELDNSAPILRDRTALRISLGKAMTNENNAMFTGIMREYMQQAAGQAQREAQSQNRKGQIGLMAISEARRVGAMDVRASLQRIGAKAMPTLAAMLPASGINAASVTIMQGKLDEFKAAFPDGGSNADKSAAFMTALNMISDDQQRVLVEALYKQFAPETPPMKKVETEVPEAAPGKKPEPASEPVLQPR
jgi:hypothetical protein